MNDADPFLILDLNFEHFAKMTFSLFEMAKSGPLDVLRLYIFHRAKCMGSRHHLPDKQRQRKLMEPN